MGVLVYGRPDGHTVKNIDLENGQKVEIEVVRTLIIIQMNEYVIVTV